MDMDRLKRRLEGWGRRLERKLRYTRRELQRTYGNRQRIAKQARSALWDTAPAVMNFNNITKAAVGVAAFAAFLGVTDFISQRVRDRQESDVQALSVDQFEQDYVRTAPQNLASCMRRSYVGVEKVFHRVTRGQAMELKSDCFDIAQMQREYAIDGEQNVLARCFTERSGVKLTPDGQFTDEPGRPQEAARTCYGIHRPSGYYMTPPSVTDGPALEPAPAAAPASAPVPG